MFDRVGQLRGREVRTESCNSRQGREKNNPKVLAPQHPTPVHQDEVPEEVTQGNEDIRAEEWFCFVSEALNACRPLLRASKLA